MSGTAVETVRRELHPARDTWLDDHRPGGLRVVPAAVIAAWLLEAARGQSDAGGVVELRDVRWLRPLRVPDGGTELRLDVLRERAALGVELRCARHDAAGRVFGEALAACARAREAARSGPPPPPLDATRATAAEPPASFHGPTFRCLRGPLRLASDGIDANLDPRGEPPATLPALAAPGAPDCRHLDGALQAARVLAASASRGFHAPYAAAILRIAPGAPRDRPLAVRVRRGSSADDELDVWCLDAAGVVRVELRGYRIREARFDDPAPGHVR